jgi:hypothetical protein
VVSLVYAFRKTLASTDERALQNYRLEKFQRVVADYVDAQVLERVALGRLREICSQANVVFAPYISKDSVGTTVTAGTVGVVWDINVKLLRDLARQTSGLTIAAYLGQHVSAESRVLIAESPLGAAAQEIVRIQQRRFGDPLIDAITDLHQVAMEAVRTKRVDSFQLVQEAWQLVLVAFPREWARYGQVYDTQLDAPVSFLARSHVDAVMQELYEEAMAVVDQNSRELAFSITAMPAQVAREALELRSAPLIGRMLRWLVALHFLAFDKPGDVNKLLADRAVRAFLDLSQFVIWPHLEQVRRADELEAPLAAAMAASHAAHELLRGMAERHSLQALTAFDRRWSNLGGLWTPEQMEPSDLTMRIARRDLPAGSAELQQLEGRHQERQLQVDAKNRLARLDRTLRFGLCFWATHRLAQGQDRPLWAAVFNHFAGLFNRANVLVETVGDALEGENRGSLDWSRWLMDELPEDEVHTSSPTVDIIRAAITILMVSPVPVPPSEWIRDYKAQWEGYLQFLRQEPDHLSPLVDPADIAARIDAVSGHLAHALREQSEEDAEKVRRLLLSESTVDKISALARAGWDRGRWVTAMLGAYSNYRETVEPHDPAAPAFGRAEWLPKQWFVDAGPEVSWDGLIRDYGQSISSSEVTVLLQALEAAPAVTVRDGEMVADTVVRAVDDLRGHGYKPQVLFIPLDLNLERQLGLELSIRGRPSPPPDWQLPPEGRPAYLGVLDRVHVVAIARYLQRTAYVVDLEAWATWHQSFIAPPVGHRLQVVVRTYDAVQALQLARENKALLRTPSRKTIADRAKEVQGLIELRVHEYFRVQLNDGNAARRIDL